MNFLKKLNNRILSLLVISNIIIYFIAFAKSIIDLIIFAFTYYKGALCIIIWFILMLVLIGVSEEFFNAKCSILEGIVLFIFEIFVVGISIVEPIMKIFETEVLWIYVLFSFAYLAINFKIYLSKEIKKEREENKDD